MPNASKAAQGALTFTGTLVQATQDQSAWDVYDLDKIDPWLDAGGDFASEKA